MLDVAGCISGPTVLEISVKAWKLDVTVGFVCFFVFDDDRFRIGVFDNNDVSNNGDDLDLQRRLADCGWKALYVPAARVRHRKRKSSQQRPLRTRFEFYRSMWIYYHSHHGADPLLVKGGVSAGILLFGAAAVFRRMLPGRLGF